MDLINIGYQFKNTAHENSTKEAKDAFEALKRLIHIPGKIRNIDIATAYTDTKALLGLIKLCKDSRWADRRTEPTIRIFLDWQSTVKLKAELESLVQCPEKPDKSAKKLLSYLEKKRTDPKIELYAIKVGVLFHSKAILVETNTHSWACVGSVNFTTRGLTSNAEIGVIFSCEKNAGSKTISKKLISDVKDYFAKIYTEAESFNTVSSRSRSASDLRSIFLNGELWYEDKEQQTFAFPLRLPDEIKKEFTSGGPIVLTHLGSKLNDSLNVLSLPEVEKLIDLEDTDTSRKTAARWKKRLCIQTCFGLWAPKLVHGVIQNILDLKYESRKQYLERVREIFLSEGERLKVIEAIKRAHDKTWTELNEQGFPRPVVALSNDEVQISAEKWAARLAEKLKDSNYWRRLSLGADYVEMPDIWSANPHDSQIFENSFFNSLDYEMSRPKRRSKIAIALGSLPNPTDMKFPETILTKWDELEAKWAGIEAIENSWENEDEYED